MPNLIAFDQANRYKDENGNPIPVSKGLPDKLTPEVERDALISLDAVPIEEEKPVIKGDKLVYENRLQGQVWRPEDDTSRAKIATLLKMYYANFPCDDDVAELLNVRVDTLKNWLKIHPDLHDAKDEGMYGIRSMYLDALKRSACGETYFEEVASGGQVHTVQKVRAPDPRALELVLKQTFKGKFKGEETGNKTAVQINILPFEKNGGV